jgi:hypothetical protein
MNLGDNIVLKDIALFSQTEAEEAAMVMRYFYTKEESLEKKVIYEKCLAQLEKHLLLTYNEPSPLRLEPMQSPRQVTG